MYSNGFPSKTPCNIVSISYIPDLVFKSRRELIPHISLKFIDIFRHYYSFLPQWVFIKSYASADKLHKRYIAALVLRIIIKNIYIDFS